MGCAIISPCGTYRYRLERDGPGAGSTAVIMVNPSTADATENDATIRKLLGFGKHNGWGRIIVGNLFAYRATDIRELADAADPVGPDNDAHLQQIMADVSRVVFAWGAKAKLPKRLRTRWRKALYIAQANGLEPLCIGATAKDGHPCHPLMLAYELPVQPWSPAL